MERTLDFSTAADRRMDAHLSADEVAALVDGRLTPDRRAAVDAHLIVCHQCRVEVSSVAAIVDSAPTGARARRPWAIGAVAIAAGIIGIVAISLRQRGRDLNRTSELRAPANVTTITSVAPVPGATMRLDSLAFTWRAMENVSAYKLVVTDSVGSPLLELSTGDTTVGPIRIAGAKAGQRYLWYVDALRNDGTSMSGSQMRFSVRAR